MFPLAFLLLMQLPLHEVPIDESYIVRIRASHSGTSLLRVFLVDRTNANRYWEIAAIREDFEHDYNIKRADRTSVVIERSRPDYGIYEGSVKLFFDEPSKRLLKRIDFNKFDALKSVGADEARRVGLDPGLFGQIKNVDPYSNFEFHELPPPLRGQILPQSTYRDFARARPRRVQDGYDERATIEEKIGPYQVVKGRIWFGKTFYDGEGMTGVGDLGYFDVAQKKFTFLHIRELVDWSVSAILVEDDVIWAGLELLTEGVGGSGGLVRHDLKTSNTKIHAIEDAIRTIHRSSDALVMSTTNGIYVLKEDRLTRHRAEPNMEGKLMFYSENP